MTPPPPPAPRSRPVYAALLLATIALGLLSRRHAASLPPAVAAYAGDVLWATMVAWLLALALPRARTAHLAAGALLVATLVELSQLYRAPWLDAIRATRPGALALGQGFLWSDLACYAAGAGVAAALDAALRARGAGHTATSHEGA